MTRQMVNAILEMKEYNRFSKGIFSWVGFRTRYIPYENVERAAGTTSCRLNLCSNTRWKEFLHFLPLRWHWLLCWELSAACWRSS